MIRMAATISVKKMLPSYVISVLVIFGITILTDGSKTKSKSVTTFLETRWKDTPIIMELCEFLADENNELLWNYIDVINEINLDNLRKKSDKAYHDEIISRTSTLLSAPKMALLKLALSLRMYSPKVEMFQQISLDKNLPEDCISVLEINGVFTCDLSTLENLISSGMKINKTNTYKLDHHYPGGEMSHMQVILYSDIDTESFKKFHPALKKFAQEGKIDYVLRHYLKNRSNKNVRLSGYGVELAIKSTEYKAQDDTKVKVDDVAGSVSEGEDKRDEIDGFVFSQLKKLHPSKKSKLDDLRNHLIESSNEMPTLKVWQIQELSLQAAQRIVSISVDDALHLLSDISQNFPLQTRSLVKTVVKDEMKQEIAKNQKSFAENHNIAPSEASLFVNGIYFDLEVSDIYSIFDVIREEQRTMDGLHALGVDDAQLAKMLNLDFQLSKQEYAVDIRDTAIQYINDLENDRKYFGWASSISEILRPTYPGILRTIRKNIYHLVFVLDPSVESSKDLLKLAESFYVHSAPIRIGLLFTVNQDLNIDGFKDPGVALLNAFNFVAQEKNQLYSGLSFITDVYALVGEKEIKSSDVIDAFKQKYSHEDLDLIFGADSDYDTGRKLSWEFIIRTGLPPSPQVLMNGIPLDQTMLNTDMFEEAVLNEVMKHTTIVQKAVYKNELNDFHDVIDYLMKRPSVMPRLNDRVLSGKGTILDLTGRPILKPTFKKFSLLSNKDMSGTIIAHRKYMTARDDFSFRPITHWIICDLETEKGRQLLHEAIEQVRLSNDIRVSVMYNVPADSSGYPITKAVHVALEKVDKNINKKFIDTLLVPENAAAIIDGTKSAADFAVKGMDKEEFEAELQKQSDEFIKIHRIYCDRVLYMKPGDRAVITNGRILGPFDDAEKFTIDDFNLLERYSLNTYGEKLQQTFEEINEQGEEDSISDLAMRVTALLLARSSNKMRYEPIYHSAEHSVVKIPARLPGYPSFDIKAIVDPVSRGAQRMASLLTMLHEVLNARMWIFLNSEDKLSDLPLKSFFRYVLEPEMKFNEDGSATAGPVARFHNMPNQPLLTLHMVTPDNWLVEVVRSPHDLDNIHFEDVTTHVSSEFQLTHLLLEGHCFEQSTGNPPRGLQFTLGTSSSPILVDTIVMANLGYFQLKANPGAWLLQLRQGRSSEIYDVVSHDGTDSPTGSSEVQILISSFKSHTVKLKVSKKLDKLHADLLSDGDEGPGIWNSFTSTFVGSSKKADDEEETKINIFSVASGHLYERFLRIMMMSVLKHTKTPVKFWFLNNYLSPTIKDFLPHMAKEYGFEYELVQYQWPRWLHQQTERQRTIWGYKILFLDVLFPLDVKKIIFVDADQIVRTDLKELVDFDLGGAPYGYTPFCESRRDMDGYRFWKSGYWSTHLQGRKYHISALYVVDLKKFRLIAAGDRLRGQYQGLSQDPNSLSNLDQDLPNNMIHQVSIKSLPQEWLWCETWCDDASKAKAKTIDLCNNPKTKEPKLASAMRIVPEWKSYDAEIKSLMDRIQHNKSSEEMKETKHEHAEL